MTTAWLTPAVVAALVAVLVQIAALLLGHRVSFKQIAVTDNASWREALVRREETLLEDIRELGKRCSEQDKSLQEANLDILKLQKRIIALELAISSQGGVVPPNDETPDHN